MRDEKEWESFVRKAKEKEDYYWELMADNRWQNGLREDGHYADRYSWSEDEYEADDA